MIVSPLTSLLLLGLVSGGVGVWLLARRRAANAAGQALLQATEVGDLVHMHALLSKPINLEARNAYGWTPLHLAAAGGDVAVVQLLLQHGADVHARSNIGSTPLNHALTYGGRQAVVELLLAHGAQGQT